MHGVSRPESIGQKCLSRSAKERKQKQHAEQKIHSAKYQVRRMKSLLEIKHEQGGPIPELLSTRESSSAASAPDRARSP